MTPTMIVVLATDNVPVYVYERLSFATILSDTNTCFVEIVLTPEIVASDPFNVIEETPTVKIPLTLAFPLTSRSIVLYEKNVSEVVKPDVVASDRYTCPTPIWVTVVDVDINGDPETYWPTINPEVVTPVSTVTIPELVALVVTRLYGTLPARTFPSVETPVTRVLVAIPEA